MERIQQLIKIYTASAVNLRKVADLAEQQPTPNTLVATTSRAKALVYESVVKDLEYVLLGEGGN